MRTRILFIMLLGLMVVYVMTQQENVTKVVFLDVGQGSAAYVSHDGFQVIIDTGETNQMFRELGKVHPWWDRTIDLVIASHPDKDHIGMIPRLISRYRVATYLETYKESTSPFHQAIHNVLQGNDTELRRAKPPLRWTVDELQMNVLHPRAENADNYSDNDSSLVLLVTISGLSFLFMGDAGVEIEQELMSQYGNLLDVDVLVVGHHGSKTSTGQEFLDLTTPTYGVISVGADNRYGHPHKSVLGRLRDNNVQVLRTDELGSIGFYITKEGSFDIVVR